jgi:hypothetical protein
MWRRRQAVVALSILPALILTGCVGGSRQPLVSGPESSDPATAARDVKVTPTPASIDKTPGAVSEASTTATASAAAVPDEVTPSALRGVDVPVWHVGDQWAFRWESSQGQGEYVWTVDRIAVLDGVEHYVIKVGPREIFYRARDLATALETTDGVAELRHVPPRLSFSWPLTPGTMWRQSMTQETGPGRQRLARIIAWEVESEERIHVEAGTFDTLKIVAWHDFLKSGAVMYEMWYAPHVKQWVRLQEHFPTGVRYRELTEFALN